MSETLPILDPAALADLRMLDDDGSFVAEIVELFRSETPRRVEAVLAACERADAGAVTHEAHALKSSAAQLGALRLSGLCRRIELLAREGRLAEATTAVSELGPSAREADGALAEALRPAR
jgi:HPt (histidine-containing phosphotransfer) domain-containing protein